MRHPLDPIPVIARKPLFFAFLAGTLILFAVFQQLDTPMKTSAAPNSIVSFEFAGTPPQAQAIIDSWLEAESESGPGFVNPGFAYAAFGLGIDYLFMPVYATTLALGILLAARKHSGWFMILGAWVGWGAYAAAVFDAVENFALARMLLLNQVWSPYPEVAAICASVKFGLLIIGLIYALVGWLWPRNIGT